MGGGEVGGASKTKSEPNVVPLCDILLVLLIIFMVITPLVKQGQNVKLPEAVNLQDQGEGSKFVTVFLKSDGAIYLDDKLVEDITKLTSLIEERFDKDKNVEKGKVLLKGDQEVLYGRVTEVMDEIRRLQIDVVGLVAEKSTSGQ
jgi:biopolymer transport protein TolR